MPNKPEIYKIKIDDLDLETKKAKKLREELTKISKLDVGKLKTPKIGKTKTDFVKEVSKKTKTLEYPEEKHTKKVKDNILDNTEEYEEKKVLEKDFDDYKDRNRKKIELAEKRLEKEKVKLQLKDVKKVEAFRKRLKARLMEKGFSDVDAEKESLKIIKRKKEFAELTTKGKIKGWIEDKKGRIEAAKENKVVGNTFNILTETLSKLAVPLAAFSGIAGIIATLIDAHSQMKTLTRGILEATYASGEWADNLEDPEKLLENIQGQVSTLNDDLRTFGLTGEDTVKTLETFAESGAKVMDSTGTKLNETTRELVRSTATFSKTFHISMDDSARAVNDFLSGTDMAAANIEESFTQMSMDAAKSGLGVNRFFSTVQQASSELSLFGTHLQENSKLMLNLAKTGAMSSKEVADMFSAIQAGTKNSTQETRMFIASSKIGQEIIAKGTEKTIKIKQEEIKTALEATEGYKKAEEAAKTGNTALKEKYEKVLKVLEKGEQPSEEMMKGLDKLDKKIFNTRDHIADLQMKMKSGSLFDYEQLYKMIDPTTQFEAAVKKVGEVLHVDVENDFPIDNAEIMNQFDAMLKELGYAPELFQEMKNTALHTRLMSQGKDKGLKKIFKNDSEVATEAEKAQDNLLNEMKNFVTTTHADTMTLPETMEWGFKMLEMKLIDFINFMDTAKIFGHKIFGSSKPYTATSDTKDFKKKLGEQQTILSNLNKKSAEIKDNLAKLAKEGGDTSKSEEALKINEAKKKEVLSKLTDSIKVMKQGIEDHKDDRLSDVVNQIMGDMETGIFDVIRKKIVVGNLQNEEMLEAGTKEGGITGFLTSAFKTMRWPERFITKKLTGFLAGGAIEKAKMDMKAQQGGRLVDYQRSVAMSGADPKTVEDITKDVNTSPIADALNSIVDTIAGLIPATVSKRVSEHFYAGAGVGRIGR